MDTEIVEGEIDERRKRRDRRLSPRTKVLRGGKTFWPNGDSAECIIHNISITGAKLEFFGPTPNSFDLVVEGDSVRRPCCVVWRNAKLIGVKFLVEVDLAPIIPERKPVGGFRQYIETCQTLAQRVSPSDREMLLEMVQGWKKAIRLIRNRDR